MAPLPNPDVTTKISPIQAEVANEAKAEALRRILRGGTIAAGVGGGLGLLGAVMNMRARPPVDKLELATSDVTVPAATPTRFGKRAVAAIAPPDQTPVSESPDWADKAVSKLMPSVAGANKPDFASPQGLRGDLATSPGSVPWYLPAATAATIGGGAGTYALIKWLAQQKNKADTNHELRSASRAYNAALQRLSKGAAVQEGCWEKLASLSEMAGTGAGIYGTIAAALSMLAARKGYQYSRKRDERKIMEDAIEDRDRFRAMSSPPPIRLSRSDIPRTAAPSGLA